MRFTLLARDLHKRFGEGAAAVEAVRGVDLALAPGEFVALTGPSGCGKSTLLHLIAGFERPDRGTIEIGGERVDRLSERAWALRRRRTIGFVFQFFNLVDTLTVQENVELPAIVAGTRPRVARQRARALLARLGVENRAAELPSRLSGGEQQRVAIARALAAEPLLLLADEPTGSLDSAATSVVLGLLREVHARGQTIVLATHDQRVASAADRVLQMRDGRIVEEAVLVPGSASSTLERLWRVDPR
ncbi:Lipoprotein-releasing system ATP-binding protein LolD [bacterium HR41]|nr:ABC transporter ATP-binding protein [Thermoleophilum sp.]GBD45397.1 Lipoprotein-releasing system ATP-binding protein LolD [bacterium HR41]